jgi:protein-disulfide isomerase
MELMMRFFKTFCASILLLGVLGTSTLAFDIKTMTPDEKIAFNSAIRDYLLTNPEVLVEVINILEQKKQTLAVQEDVALVAANLDALVKDGYSFVGGNPNGDVTIVEFLDYRCGYCKKAFPDVTELLRADGNIRFVVKEYPILGEQSVLASRFALSVQRIAGDMAYGEIHDALMDFRGEFVLETLSQLATDQGLDATSIMAGMNAPEIDAILNQNQILAAALKITGTPAFIFQDQMVRGYMPLENMQALIAQVRGEG